VDVIAPAAHVLGLRVPGSFIDTLATNTGQVGTRFQRGSGTSEATAITSGVMALLAQKYPAATPDQLKALINATGTPLSTVQASVIAMLGYRGHGIVNAAKAIATALPTSTQTATASTGSGTLGRGPGWGLRDRQRGQPDRSAGHLRPRVHLHHDGHRPGQRRRLDRRDLERRPLVR
jgi:serine protease AprX